jgi:hypothetical protein
MNKGWLKVVRIGIARPTSSLLPLLSPTALIHNFCRRTPFLIDRQAQSGRLGPVRGVEEFFDQDLRENIEEYQRKKGEDPPRSIVAGKL